MKYPLPKDLELCLHHLAQSAQPARFAWNTPRRALTGQVVQSNTVWFVRLPQGGKQMLLPRHLRSIKTPEGQILWPPIE